MSKPLLLFDFDGTIADTFNTSIREFCAETGRPEPTLAEIRQLRSMTSREIVKTIGLPWWKLPFVIRRVKHRMAEALHGVHTHKGIPAALRALHRRADIGIVTSNDEIAVRLFLERHKISYDFIIGDVGLFSKARVLKRIARTRNVLGYVGDETRDIEAAHKAGMRAIAVSWGYNTPAVLKKFKPDVFVKDAKQLQKL